MDINYIIESVIDCAYKVRSKLVAGYVESVYKNAMVIELRKHGLSYITEKHIKVYYDNYVVGDFKADIIVEDCLILELKAVQNLVTAHSIQLVNYLIQLSDLALYGLKAQ